MALAGRKRVMSVVTAPPAQLATGLNKRHQLAPVTEARLKARWSSVQSTAGLCKSGSAAADFSVGQSSGGIKTDVQAPAHHGVA